MQKKFGEVCKLEKENRVWNRIREGLPVGQLSFILKAALNTLPTPINLRRWKLILDSKCELSDHRAQLLSIFLMVVLFPLTKAITPGDMTVSY